MSFGLSPQDRCDVVRSTDFNAFDEGGLGSSRFHRLTAMSVCIGSDCAVQSHRTCPTAGSASTRRIRSLELIQLERVLAEAQLT
jgi:hypothetical protein